jgi:glycosyltransferase involved in cell wall biosynthesis
MNESKPLVSVILPVYNAEKFLKKSVRSVTAQSYKNLEIIIINDCSTDNSGLILEQLQKKDARIIILSNETNSGISKTLNKGIEKSNGKYIARMDADDICFNDRIEKQVSFLEENKSIAICGCSFIKIDENGKTVGRVIYPTDDIVLKAELFFYCPFAHPAMMMRRTVLNETGLYQDYAPAEDYELWLRIAEKFQVANLADNLVYYRTHSSNSTVVLKNKMFNALNNVVCKHIKNYHFAENFIQYHLKFLEGTWYTRTSTEEIKNIKNWKKELLALNQGNRVLNHVFDKYISLGMLSILKSKQNTLRVKLRAAQKLLTINPFITAKHFLDR